MTTIETNPYDPPTDPWTSPALLEDGLGRRYEHATWKDARYCVQLTGPDTGGSVALGGKHVPDCPAAPTGLQEPVRYVEGNRDGYRWAALFSTRPERAELLAHRRTGKGTLFIHADHSLADMWAGNHTNRFKHAVEPVGDVDAWEDWGRGFVDAVEDYDLQMAIRQGIRLI